MASERDFDVRLLTPPGLGGVAVVEVRGAASAERLARIGVPVRPTGRLFLANLHTASGPLDEALVCQRGPDWVELHVHGSAAVLAELFEALDAKPGQTGKPEDLDLEELCMRAMVAAPSESGARLALYQTEGHLRQALEAIAELPWPAALPALRELVGLGAASLPWFVPKRVVLQGPVNAGKSTLFNALVGFERVITSPEQGTTRDAVGELIQLGGWPVELIDTAGLRTVQEQGLEGRGQALGQKLAAESDWVLFLAPPGFAGEVPAGATLLPTHGDLPGAELDAIQTLHAPAEAVERVRNLFEATLQESLQVTPQVPPLGQACPCGPELMQVLQAILKVASQAQDAAVLRDFLARGRGIS